MLELLDQIKKKSKNPHLIERSFECAKKAHQGQKRYSGEEYILHPLRVALSLTARNLDSQTIAAALLHDVPDDTQVSLEEIEKEFGKEVAFLVDGVSKLSKIRYPKYFNLPSIINPSISLQAENLRKMFFAMANDLRIILIKLADRLHNMETLKYIPKEKQKRFALETLEIFAPIADRLGMGEVKIRLENLAFPYLYPKEYQWLTENVEKRYGERKNYLEKIEPTIKEMLKKEGVIVLDIHSRAKSYWSLYQKLLKHKMNFGEIHDLVALRIIVKDLDSCYKALGVLHKRFRPLIGKIQDFIALPKPNGYQSLHTTCFCLEGKLIEIQIRTPEMHETAENGICAHWAYKEKVDLKAQQKKYAWVEQLKDWQKEILGSRDFFDGLKFDFFKNRIFVFTPKGEIINLPEGACPIDFAYHIHTEIGNHCVGARINGKITQVSASLKNGDVVEILTDKNKIPSRDWLKFVRTSLARSHVRKEVKDGFLEIIKKKISPAKIAKNILRKRDLLTAPKVRKPTQVVVIGGEKGVFYSLAKCCNPKPGDKIKAFITKTNKATIHKISCQDLKVAQLKFPKKIFRATWKLF